MKVLHEAQWQDVALITSMVCCLLPCWSFDLFLFFFGFGFVSSQLCLCFFLDFVLR